MKKSKYKLADIAAGDSVFFSIRGVNNQSKYWTISSIAEDGKIKINMDGKDTKEELDINIGDIEILHSSLEKELTKKK